MSTGKKRVIKRLSVVSLSESKCDELKHAKIVFQYAVQSVDQFYKIYQFIRYQSKGTTTHGEQDLLRAMLVFACSGLDAVLKQLIKDALQKVVNTDSGAHLEFQKFLEKQLKKGEATNEKDKIDISLIASALASENPRILLLNRLQNNLGRDSLQSRDQLLKIAAQFAITKDQVLKDANKTDTAFNVRNGIIHEMDVDLGKAKNQGKKKRKQRSAATMVELCENILNIAAEFINVVLTKLGPLTRDKGIAGVIT